jgi:hypothetical protein
MLGMDGVRVGAESGLAWQFYDSRITDSGIHGRTLRVQQKCITNERRMPSVSWKREIISLAMQKKSAVLATAFPGKLVFFVQPKITDKTHPSSSSRQYLYGHCGVFEEARTCSLSLSSTSSLFFLPQRSCGILQLMRNFP